LAKPITRVRGFLGGVANQPDSNCDLNWQRLHPCCNPFGTTLCGEDNPKHDTRSFQTKAGLHNVVPNPNQPISTPPLHDPGHISA